MSQAKADPSARPPPLLPDDDPSEQPLIEEGTSSPMNPNAWRFMESKIKIFQFKFHEIQKNLDEQWKLLEDMQKYCHNQGEPPNTIPEGAAAAERTGAPRTSVAAPRVSMATPPAGESGAPQRSSQQSGPRNSANEGKKSGSRKTDFSHLELAQSVRMETFFTQVTMKLPDWKEGRFEYIKVLMAKILGWRFFEPLMGIFILWNAANLGWTIDSELRGRDVAVPVIIEQILLGIFTAEICLRLFVKGCSSLKDPWNLFDFVLICTSLFTELLTWLWRNVSETSTGDGALDVLERIVILRMLRILRLARAVRLVKSFKSLWRLVQGLMQCGVTMASAFLLMAGTTFMFACFGAEFITKPFRNDPDIGSYIETYFSTLPKILITLFQFITLDGVSEFYMPLVLTKPALGIYFIILLMVVSIALMNLITALLVEHAISSQRMDDEMVAFYTRAKLKDLEPHFRTLFRKFDVSGDGVLRVGEILETMQSGLEIPKVLQDVVNHARMIDLFDALDKDQSGFVTEDEFVEGLGYMALSDVPLETMQILHLVRACKREVETLRADMGCAPLDEDSNSNMQGFNDSAVLQLGNAHPKIG